MSAVWTLFVGTAVCLFGLLSRSLLRQYREKLSMPPGPTGLPLLGNVFQVPKSTPWVQYTEWSSEFGNVYSLNLAGQPIVVLNDFASAADLLDRRSSIYSDRPPLIVAGEIICGGLFISLMRYGELWRKMRRAISDSFSPRSSQKYCSLQEHEASILTRKLLQDPNKIDDHLKSKDTLVERIIEFVEHVTLACVPGAHLVELFPWMLYLPAWLAPWKRKSLQRHKMDTKMFEELFADAEHKSVSGEYRSSLSTSLLESEGQHGLDRKESSWLAGAMFAAGAETTSAVLSAFFFAMTLHPEVVRRAQSEIDAVVGRDRVPSFEDQPRLPYVTAIAKEVLRWRPVAPLGLPHRSIQDDWYNGYFIPKGTLIVSNIWQMNHDPMYFANPSQFCPERYLAPDGGLVDIPGTHGEGHLSYGSGRRICAGKDLANQSLFINIATVLWAADIKVAVGPDGQPVVPDVDGFVDNGIVVRPAAFQCSIVARSPEVPQLLEAASSK